jgi:hypothetical protein
MPWSDHTTAGQPLEGHDRVAPLALTEVKCYGASTESGLRPTFLFGLLEVPIRSAETRGVGEGFPTARRSST